MRAPDFDALKIELKTEYDELVAELRKAQTEHNRLEAALADARKDRTIMGTSQFKTLLAAVSYYGPYGFHREDVDRKIAEKEISVSSHLPDKDACYWDEDDRMHIRGGPGLLGLRDSKLSKAAEIEGHLGALRQWDVRFLAVRRLAIAPVTEAPMEYKIIRDILAAPWAEELPHCSGGRPIYGPDVFAAEEAKPANQRLVLFELGSTTYAMGAVRALKNSTDADYWGMMSDNLYALFINGEYKASASGRRAISELFHWYT
jgi:hypothetical protein